MTARPVRLIVALATAAAVAATLNGCSTPPRQGATQAAPPPGARAAPAAVAPAVDALPRSDAATLATLHRVLAGTHRSEANRARDIYRHPYETLEFFGIRQDMIVLEIWPGAGGWYTEVLAPLLRDHGRYVAAGWDPATDSKFVQDSIRSFRSKLAGSPELYERTHVTALQYPNALAPVAPGSVDLAVSFRNLHNWMARDEAPAMLQAIFTALKPGGILGLVDHRADPKAAPDPKAKNGYVSEQYAIELARAAGFVLVGSSEINANPRDTRDYDLGVWTLPPTWRLGDKDRERYAAIGESDRFTLKFRKPPAH